MRVVLPHLPFAGFPLRPHPNGQWYKSIWNPRTRRSQQRYFGSWRDDPKGIRAINDPQTGWLARQAAIKAGIDNLQVNTAEAAITLGELMGRFLTFKRAMVSANELSPSTLRDYLIELEKFVVFLKPGTPVGSLRPEHFSAFMKYLIEQRKLGRHARRRVRACINAMLRYGAKNAWYTMPSTGTDWVAPATDPDSVRQARLRAGLRDYSDRIITGEELDRLLKRASPAFKAIILLGINCGMGPADIGRLRWNMIDMKSGHMKFPRPKTGVMRHGYLWKKTRKALRCARLARQNLKAWDREGDCSLVFLTRSGLPYYREREVHKLVEIGDKKASKLVGISVDNAVSITFRRMAKELKLEGVHFYRLRHTFKTLGKRGGDKEALDLMMGHKDRSVGRIYDHEEIGWRRIRRVARIIYRQLWASPKRQEDTPRPKGRMRIVGGGEWAVA